MKKIKDNIIANFIIQIFYNFTFFIIRDIKISISLICSP